MLIVIVDVRVKAGMEEAFRVATLENARNSIKEPGIARFDVLQDREDAGHFTLIEVFRTSQAPLDHKETEHFKVWRDTVADMMAAPRQSTKFDNLFPDEDSW